MIAKPVGSVVMNGGQGDVVMAACGLHAMLLLAPEVFASGLTCYTRSYIAPVIATLLPECRVVEIENVREAQHPRYYTSANTSGSTLLRNVFGSDYYINFSAGRRRASFGAEPQGTFERMGQFLTDLAMFRSTSWRRHTPAYYGLRMWAPLAERAGKTEIDLLRSLHRSFPVLKERLVRGAQAARAQVGERAKLAIFPVGKSFQTIPAEFLVKLVAKAGVEDYRCYFPAGNPRQADYEGMGLRCGIANSTEELLGNMAAADVVIACDSLPSHLAQLVARRHLALMSHDLPQHTLHPAADSLTTFVPMPCVPCRYVNIGYQTECVAKLPHCGVFDDERYLADAARKLDFLFGDA